MIGLALPLVMLINLPLGYDQLLTMRLQQITSGLSSVMLDVLAIPHALNNNVIQLATRELFVAEACSGLQFREGAPTLEDVFVRLTRLAERERLSA